MGDELSREQAQNGVNFDFEVKFDLEGQGQSPPKTIGILTKVFYTYGPNLVILAWTGDELSRGQTWWRTDGLTDGRTDAGNDNTRRPILAIQCSYIKKIHMIIETVTIYIYIYIKYIFEYVKFSASHFSDLARCKNLPGGRQ